jgi:hypothetical protein
MPVLVKIILSIVVLTIAYYGYHFLMGLGQDLTPYLALFLGVFSVISFWVFPEVQSKKKE